MAKKELLYINIGLATLCFLVVSLTLYFLFFQKNTLEWNDFQASKKTLPKNAFEQDPSAYEKINSALFDLKFAPYTMQLPDLKKYLMYYGKNGRPDAKIEKPMVHLGFIGNKQPSSLPLEEKIFIFFDKKLNPPQYNFSPHNEETPLWIEAKDLGHELQVNVFLKTPEGIVVQNPPQLAHFSMAEKEFVKMGGGGWEVGTYRVDGSLLARQKARWCGPDKFLERHGGKEYQEIAGKHRIDFGEGTNAYSVFVGLNDVLVWKNNAWQNVIPGADSINHTLMLVKKIDERLMNLEVWDPEGKSRMVLNLLKTSDPPLTTALHQNFKFVGARTRSQFVFEINQERVLLSPKDWLVLTDQGWKKLITAEDIDDYVNRKLVGPLFVFDGLSKKEDRQVLIGTIFNTTRTDMQNVELQVTQGSTKKNTETPKNPKEGMRKREESPMPYAKVANTSPNKDE